MGTIYEYRAVQPYRGKPPREPKLNVQDIIHVDSCDLPSTQLPPDTVQGYNVTTGDHGFFPSKLAWTFMINNNNFDKVFGFL